MGISTLELFLRYIIAHLSVSLVSCSIHSEPVPHADRLLKMCYTVVKYVEYSCTHRYATYRQIVGQLYCEFRIEI